MKKTTILFFASFAAVFCINFQVINIVEYKYIHAFVTSLFISWSSFYMYQFVPGKLTWYEFLSYCLGGAIGVVLSMAVQQYKLI